MSGDPSESTTTTSLIFGRWAVSFRVWALVSLLLLTPISLRNSPASGLSAVLSAIVGCLAFGLVLLLARVTWLRLNWRWLPRPVLVLAAWIGACILRLVALGATTGEGPLISSPSPAAVLVPGVLAILAAMALFSYVFALRDHLEATSRALVSATRDLADRQARKAQTLRRQEELLASSVASLVLPSVDSLVRQIDRMDESTTRDQLLELAESTGDNARGLVREVSHEVAEGPHVGDTPSSDGLERAGHPRPPGRPWRVSPQAWTGLLLLLTCIPALTLWIPRLGASAGIIVVVVMIPWILASPAAEGRLRPLISRSRWGYLPWVAVASGVFTAAVLILLRSPSTPIQAASQLGPFLVYFWALGMVAAALSRDLTRLDSEVRDLEQTRTAISAAIAQQDVEIDLLHRRVASILHGPVQGTLSAVTLALRLAAGPGHENRSRDEDLQRCLALLREAKDQISRLASTQPGTSPSLREHLQLLADRWAGLLTVVFVLDPGAESRLEADAGMTQTVTTVVDEAVNNSARHGRATEVSVLVRLAPDEQVTIDITDNGIGPPASPQVGLGLAVVEAAEGTWRLDRLPEGGAHLAVSLPSGQ